MTKSTERVDCGPLLSCRYRDTPENRQGHCNEKPSFWAATNYVDPWSFLKNDQKGYRQWLKTLATLDGGDHSHQVLYIVSFSVAHNQV